jgi:hypothetical protein
MKKVTTYFGNRFKNSLRGIRRRSQKQLAAASIAPVTTSEFEALEGRILLSGIGTGLNKKSVSFIDTDGDKVRVTALGKNVTFDIDLGGATNNADIANINLKGNGSLGVVVTPVGSFIRPITTRPILDPNFGLVNPGPGGSTDYTDVKFESKVQTQYYNLTPGYTNIGSITATGIPQIGSIGLVAAVVPVIDLPGTVVGNINLSTGLVAKVDQFMATNGSYLPGYGGWIAGLGDIDLWNINAKSIAGINISGIPGAGNDFMGDITVVDGIGRLTGTNSTFFGQISLTGPTATLGTVVLGGGFADGAGIVSDGDLTFNAAGFDGVLNVGGHLNLGIRGDDFSGTITAEEGISGLRAVETDPVLISNSEVTGQIFSDTFITDIFFSNADLDGGAIVAGTSIGDINIGANSGMFDSTIEAPEIGVISSYGGSGLGFGNSIIADNLGGIVIRNANLAAGNLISVSGEIGIIDIANGNLSASISAGEIGEVILRGSGDGTTGNLTGVLLTTAGDIGSLNFGFGNLTGVVKSAANIGTVEFNGGSLNGVLSAAGNIGSIDANWVSANAGSGIGDNAVISAGGTIGAILGTSTNGAGIGAAEISAGGAITSIIGESLSGDGINGLTVAAAAINAITGKGGLFTGNWGIENATVFSTGAIGPITGSGFAGGISGGNYTAGTSIASVSGTGIAGDGVRDARFVAGTSVGNITGLSSGGTNAHDGLDGVIVSAGTTIGQISGTATAGSGIYESTFVSVTGGIAGVSGKSTDAGSFGSGIDGSTFISQQGFVGAITGSAAGSGYGIQDATISAQTDIASITGTSLFGTGINGTDIHSSFGDIGAVTGTSSNDSGFGDGIANTTIDAPLGSIASITGTANGQFSGDGLRNVDAFAAEGDLTVTGSAHGGFGIRGGDFLLADGDLTVNGSTVTGTAIGGNAYFEAALGSVTINVTATGRGANGIDDATFRGESIAPLTVNLTSSQAGNAINDADFTATNGSIGAITVTNNSTTGGTGITNSAWEAVGGDIDGITVTMANTGAGAGIVDSNFAATGDIDFVTVTGTTGSGIVGNSPVGTSFVADTDGDFKGNIGDITVTVTGAGANGIIGLGGAFSVLFEGSSIGNINVAVNNSGGGSAISGATFVSTGPSTIGNITATTKGKATDAHAINDALFLSLGDIGTVTATTAGGSAIISSDFVSTEGNIGAITATSTGTSTLSDGIVESGFVAAANIGAITATTNGGDAIANSNFAANSDKLGTSATAGDIISVTATTNGQNGANSIAIFDSNFSGANIGLVNATATDIDGGHGIFASTFEASVVEPDGKGNFNDIGTIGDITADTAAKIGSGILSSNFFAGAGGSIGNITVSTDYGSGIETSRFEATRADFDQGKFTSTIGTITVEFGRNNDLTTNAAGIVDSTFLANAGISLPDLTVTGVGSGIVDSFFNADADFGGVDDVEGNLGNILVDLNGRNTTGITATAFLGANIGNIDVLLQNDAKTSGAAMSNADFIALAGNIGNINVLNEGVEPTSSGITNGSEFSATGNIGTITVAVDGGDGITGSTFIADSDADLNGDLALGGISVTTNNGFGIDASTFRGVNIGNINVAVLGADGLDAIINSNFTATGGNIGTITATTAGAESADAIDTSNFLATNNIGAVNASSTNADGDDGIDESEFIADSDGDLVGDLGSITASSVNSDGILDSIFSGANIGNVIATVSGVTGDDAMDNANFTATAGSIGTITATSAGENETNRGILDSTFLATEGIGLVTSTSVGSGIVGSFFQANTDADETGDLARVNVLVTGGNGANGIIGSNFLGANIGAGGNAISVTLLNTKAGTAILQSNFAVSAFVETTPGKFDSTGVIGSIFVDNFSLTGNGIDNSSFKAGAAGSIGNITVFNDGDIAITAAKFDADLTSAGQTLFTSTIGQVSVFAITNAGIAGSGFTAYNGIGTITVNSVGDGIDDSEFNANFDNNDTGDIGDITVTVSGEGTGIAYSDFTGANLGNIEVQILDADGKIGIRDSNFTANSLTIVTAGVEENNDGTIGDITVNSASDNAGKYNAVQDSYFLAGSAGGIGNIEVTLAGEGTAVENSDFAAYVYGPDQLVYSSTMGDVTVTSGGRGINASYFAAEAGIGAIDVQTVGDGILDTEIDSWAGGNTAGGITSINVEASGENARGIAEDSFIDATEILGGITVRSTNTLGGDAFQNSSINVEQNAKIGATGNIGAMLFETAGGYDLATKTGKFAHAISLDAGYAISVGGDATSFEANVTSVTGGSAVVGDFLATPAAQIIVGGDLGSIDITNDSTELFAHGMDDIKFNVVGTLGPVTITVAGGSAMSGSVIDPVSIGDITLTTQGSAVMLNSTIATTIFDDTDPLQTGNIGAILLTGNGGLGMVGSTISAAGDITSFESKGGLLNSDIIFGDQSTLDSLTISVTEGDALNGVTIGYQSFNKAGVPNAATASIGDIDVTNTGTQLNDRGIVGSNFYAGSTGTGIGNITVDVAGGEGILDSKFIAFTPLITPLNADITDEGTFVTPLTNVFGGNPDVNPTSTAVPFPAGLTGNLEFTAPLNHTRVDGNGGFPTWNSGGIWGDVVSGNLYDGDVYTGTGSATIDLAPAAPGDSSIGSIIFYVLGTNAGQDFRITSANSTDTLILEDVNFATAVEVLATDAVATGLSAVTIETGTYDPVTKIFTPSADGFGVGQFSVEVAAAPAPDTADIGDITVNNTGVFVSSSGIVGSDFVAADTIGAIEVNVGNTPGFPLDPSGGDGIAGSLFGAYNGIDGITVTNISLDLVSDGITGSKFYTNDTIGAINVQVSGGFGIGNSLFSADDDGDKVGDITSIIVANNGAPVPGGDKYGNSKGGLGAIAGTFFGGANIGAVTASTLGTQTTSSAALNTVTFVATTTIGNITGSGAESQSIDIKAPSVGNLTFDKMADLTTAKVVIDGSVLTIGNVSADAPTGTASLFTQRDSFSAINLLTTLGTVTVDGNWQVDNDLPFITSIGNVSVGGGITGGNIVGAAAGMKIGATNAGTVSVGGITPAAGNNVTFRVDNPFTGTFNIDGAAYTDTTLPPFDGTAVDGITVNLV